MLVVCEYTYIYIYIYDFESLASYLNSASLHCSIITRRDKIIVRSRHFRILTEKCDYT